MSGARARPAPTVWLLNGDEDVVKNGPAAGDGDYVLRRAAGELALGLVVDAGEGPLELEWLGLFSPEALPPSALAGAPPDRPLHELADQPELLAAVRDVDTALRNVGG